MLVETILFLFSCTVAIAEVPTIDLGYSRYVGVYDSSIDVTRYLGVRYAASPKGGLRFRAPQSPLQSNTTNVLDATAEPRVCIQSAYGAAATNPSKSIVSRDDDDDDPEDCLFLNVYFPGESVPEKLLPVVVWIHGGGYVLGSASMYNGEDLVRESNNSVVSVVLQYRLGIFGFLAGQDVKDDGDLNAGLLDQEFALKWVQAHISNFGGDPARVTIWGQSAGGGSVIQHLIAHAGHTDPPLFSGAITSSSFIPSQYLYNDTIPEAIYSQFVDATNCSSASNALECLRTADIATLVAANSMINVDGFNGTFTTVPVVDGELIQQGVIASLAGGQLNGNSVMSISNAHDGNIFVNSAIVTPDKNASWYAQELFPKFSATQGKQIEGLYNRTGDVVEQAANIMQESILECPTYFLMTAVGKAYKGNYAIPPANHGDDLAYYFPSTYTPTFPNTNFSVAFSGALLSFVKYGDPNIKIDNSSILPTWKQWTPSTPVEMLFNRTGNEPVVEESITDAKVMQRCLFWSVSTGLTGQ